ncbi:MAG: DUF4347 domain-containing protein, partial [Victivallaceae bacterium]|nr:DUF4347 domain-containing protein [Victivallaceae bacterium]
MYQLEDRILFDGAAAIDVAEAAEQAEEIQQEVEAAQEAEQQAEQGNPESQAAPQNAADAEQSAADEVPLAADLPDGMTDASDINVLLISDALENADDLFDAASSDTIVVRYDAQATTANELLAQINDALDGEKADSIAFAVETKDGGELTVFSDETTAYETIASDVQQDFWDGIDNVMAEDGRIDILSSNLTASVQGESLVNAIAEATDHEVAASDDLTGATDLGGDWTLEHGDVDISDVYFDGAGLESFDSVLEVDARHEVAFFNSSVMNADEIIDDLDDNVEIVMLDGVGDGIEEITEYLNNANSEFDDVHIFTHGNEGYFVLNGQVIDGDAVNEHFNDFASWRSALSDTADINIFGCRLAGNDAGRQLVADIAAATGADIAAATDDVGGNDWTLDYQFGLVDPVALGITDYDYQLADQLVTSALDSGAGSLRLAVTNVGDGESITFDGSYDIGLTSVISVAGKAISIDGGSNTINISVSSGDAFDIEATGGLTLNKITSVADINNDGTLNITGNVGASTISGTGDVTVTGNLTSGSFAMTAGIVDYLGGAAQSLRGGTYYDLDVNGTSNVTLVGDVTVGNDLNTAAGSKLLAGSNTLDIAGAWNDVGTTFTAGTGRVVYSGNSQTVNDVDYNDLELAGTNFVTLNLTATVNDLVISGTYNFDDSIVIIDNDLIIDGGTLSATDLNATVAGNDLLFTANGGTLDISGVFTATSADVVVGQGTVDYSGAAAQVVANLDYYDLILSGGGTKTSAQDLDITHNMTVETGVTAAVTTNNINVAGLLNIAGTVTATNYSTTTGEVEYSSAGAQDINDWNFYDLTLSGSGTKTSAQDLDVTNNMTVELGVTAAVTTNNINVAGLLDIAGAVTATNYSTTTGEVEYSSAGVQTINDWTFYNLTISGGGAKTPGLLLSVTHDMDVIENSTANITLGLTVDNDMFIEVGSTVNLAALAPLSVANGSLEVVGTLNYNGGGFIAGSGEVIYSGANQTIMSDGVTPVDYWNLTLTGTGDKTALSDFNVANLLTIGSGVNLITGGDATLGDMQLDGGEMTVKDGVTITAQGQFSMINNSTLTIDADGGSGGGVFIVEAITAPGLSVESGSIVTVNGTLDINSSAVITDGSELIIGATGILNLSGLLTVDGSMKLEADLANAATWNYSGAFESNGDGIVEYIISGPTGPATVIDLTYNNLTLTGFASPVTDSFIWSNQRVDGTLMLDNLTVTAVNMTNNVNKLEMDGGAILNITNSLNIAGTLVHHSDSTINYSGLNAQFIAALDYYNLALSGSGDKTAAGDIGIAGAFTLTGTAEFVSSNHTVTYNGANQGVTSVNYHNLVLAGNGTKTLDDLGAGDFQVAGQMRLANDTVTLDVKDEFNITDAHFTNTGYGTVLYSEGANGQIIKSLHYNNLTMTGGDKDAEGDIWLTGDIDNSITTGVGGFNPGSLIDDFTITFEGATSPVPHTLQLSKNIIFNNLNIDGGSHVTTDPLGSPDFSIANDLTFEAGAGGKLTFVGNDLNTFSVGGSFTAGTGTVEYSTTGTRAIDNFGNNFYNLQLTAGIKTYGADLTIDNNLLIDDGALFDMDGSSLTVNNNLIFEASQGGELKFSGTDLVIGGVLTAGSGTVTYDGADQNVYTGGNYYNLVMENSGTKTANGDLIATNDWIVSAGITVDVTGAVNVGNDFTINDTSTVNINSTLNVGNDLTMDNASTLNIGSSLSVGQDFTLDNGSTATITSDTDIGRDLILNNTTAAVPGTVVTIGGALAVSRDIQINGGSTLDVESNLTTVNLTFEAGQGGELFFAGTDLIVSGTFTAGTGTGTVIYDGTDQNVYTGGTYYNLVLENAGTKSANGDLDVGNDLTVADGITVDVTGAVAVSNDFTINDASTVNISSTLNVGNKLAINDTSVLDVDGNLSTDDLTFTGAGKLFFAGTDLTISGIFTAASGTVTYDGVAQNVADLAYWNLVLDGNGTKTAANGFDVDNDLTFLAPVLLDIQSDTITVVGIFTHGEGTVQYSQVIGDQTVAALDYYNLSLIGSSTKHLVGDTRIEGAFTLVGTGTFAHDNQLVEYNGHDQDILGVTYYDLMLTSSTDPVLPRSQKISAVFLDVEHDLTMNANTELVLQGAITIGNDTTFDPETAVNYAGDNQVIENLTNGGTPVAYENLIISSIGTKYWNSNAEVNQTLLITDSSELIVNGAFNLPATTISVEDTAILTFNGQPINVDPLLFVVGEDTTVKYAALVDQDIIAANYGNLVLQGLGDRNLTGDIGIARTFTVESTVNLVHNDHAVDYNGNSDFIPQTIASTDYYDIILSGNSDKIWNSGITLDNNLIFNSDITLQVPTNLNAVVAPTNFVSNSQGTVQYTGINQDIAGLPYHNLQLSGAVGTMLGNIDMTGSLTIDTDATLETADFAINTAGDVVIDTDGTFDAGASQISVAGDWTNNGTFNAGTSTVTFNGASQNIITGGDSFYTLVFAGSDNKAMSDAVTVDNDLYVTDGVTATFDNNLSVTGDTYINDSSTLDVNGNYSTTDLTFEASENGELIFGGDTLTISGIFSEGNGMVTYDGDGNSQTVLDLAYYDLQIAGINAYNITLSNAIHDFIITSGAVTLGADLSLSRTGDPLNSYGSLSISSGASLDAAGFTIDLPGNWTNAGTFTHNSNNVIFNGAANQNINSGGSSFYDIILDGFAATQLDAIVVSNDFTINSGTWNADGHSMGIGGNWSNNDTFEHGNNEVTFAGTSNVLSGGSNFYDVILDGTAVTQLDAIVVSNDFTINSGTWNADGYSMEIGGNWSNNDTFEHGGNVVTFVGTSNVLSGGSSFYDVVLDGISVNQLDDVYLDNDLILTSGIWNVLGWGLNINNNLNIEIGETVNITLGGILDVTAETTNDGLITLNDGQAIFRGNFVGTNGTLSALNASVDTDLIYLQGQTNDLGTFNEGLSTVFYQYNGGGNQEIYQNDGISDYYDLVIGGDEPLNPGINLTGVDATINADIVILDTLNITTGNTLNITLGGILDVTADTLNDGLITLNDGQAIFHGDFVGTNGSVTAFNTTDDTDLIYLLNQNNDLGTFNAGNSTVFYQYNGGALIVDDVTYYDLVIGGDAPLSGAAVTGVNANITNVVNAETLNVTPDNILNITAETTVFATTRVGGTINVTDTLTSNGTITVRPSGVVNIAGGSVNATQATGTGLILQGPGAGTIDITLGGILDVTAETINAGLITVNDGRAIFRGDLNGASGTLTALNTAADLDLIYLQGQINDLGSFNEGLSTVFYQYNGGGTQEIYQSHGTSNYYDLVIGGNAPLLGTPITGVIAVANSDLGITNTLDVTAGNELRINTGATITVNNAITVRTDALLNITGGTLNAAQATGTGLVIEDATGGTNPGTLNITVGGILDVTADTTNDGLLTVDDGQAIFRGDFTGTNGTLTALNVAADLDLIYLQGQSNNLGTFNEGLSTVFYQYNGGGTQEIYRTDGTSDYYDLVIGGNAPLLGTPITGVIGVVNSDLVITNRLNVTADNELRINNGGTLTAHNTITVRTDAVLNVVGGTLNAAKATGTGLVIEDATGGTNPGTLNITVGGILDVAAETTNDGLLTVNDGQAIFRGNFTGTNGTLSALNAAADTDLIYLQGQTNDLGTFNEGLSTVFYQYNGGGTQEIYQNDGTTDYYDLVIGGNAPLLGTPITGVIAVVNSDLGITNTLDVTAGNELRINTGATLTSNETITVHTDAILSVTGGTLNAAKATGTGLVIEDATGGTNAGTLNITASGILDVTAETTNDGLLTVNDGQAIFRGDFNGANGTVTALNGAADTDLIYLLSQNNDLGSFNEGLSTVFYQYNGGGTQEIYRTDGTSDYYDLIVGGNAPLLGTPITGVIAVANSDLGITNTLEVTAGNELRINNGGTLTSNETITIRTDAVLNVVGGTLNAAKASGNGLVIEDATGGTNAGTLNITVGGILDVTAETTNDGLLTVNDGQAIFRGNFNGTNGVLSALNAVTGTDLIYLQGQTNDLGAFNEGLSTVYYQFTGGGTQDVYRTDSISDYYDLVIGGNAPLTGAPITGVIAEVHGDLDISNTLVVTDGNLFNIISGTVTVSGVIRDSGVITVNTGTVLNRSDTIIVHADGVINIAGGIVNALANGVSLLIEDATGGLNAGQVNITLGGLLNVSADTVNHGFIIVNDGQAIFRGNLNGTDGTVTALSATADTDLIYLQGQTNDLGSFNEGLSTVFYQYNGGGTQEIYRTDGTSDYYDLVIGGNAPLLGTPITGVIGVVNSDLSIVNTLAVTAGNELRINNGGTLTSNETITVRTDAVLNVVGGTLNAAKATGTGLVIEDATGGTNAGTLNITVGGILDVTAETTNDGLLTVNDGQAIFRDNLNGTDGTITALNGAADTDLIYLQGQSNDLGSFNEGLSTVFYQYNGGGTQEIYQNDGTSDYYDLVIGGNAPLLGTPITGVIAVVNSDLGITNTLEVTAGNELRINNGGTLTSNETITVRTDAVLNIASGTLNAAKASGNGLVIEDATGGTNAGTLNITVGGILDVTAETT